MPIPTPMAENDTVHCCNCERDCTRHYFMCDRRDIPREEQCPENWAVHRTIESTERDADGCPEWITTERVGLDWVIVGGESGPHARPMHPAWARSLRDQCTAAGVPFFFKQWGEWITEEDSHSRGIIPTDGDDRFEDMPMVRVGKKAAGRLLDGREWSEFPA